MSEYLVTFPGKYGDILWSLATVKEISDVLLNGRKVDFACMPQYKSLLPLLQQQPYIDEAYVLDDWILQHSNYGDQPWQPPERVRLEYDRIWNLGYQHHPGLTPVAGQPAALIDFVAWQQGIKLRYPLPFLFTGIPPEEQYKSQIVVAYAFNNQYEDVKVRFMQRVKEKLVDEDIMFMNLQEYGWLEAVRILSGAVAFVGCRSANNVLAHGVGQENIFIYEPHPARHAQGQLGTTFGCPYGEPEVTSPLMMPCEPAADMAVTYLRKWRKQRMESKV